MAINSVQLFELIVETLKHFGLYSIVAAKLVHGTIAHESLNGYYIKQTSGPAMGICQMEPATERWIWDKYISKDVLLKAKIKEKFGLGQPSPKTLKSNLEYAILMCRLRYRIVLAPLPKSDDPILLARYWKKHYNTYKGKGKIEDFLENYRKYVDYKEVKGGLS